MQTFHNPLNFNLNQLGSLKGHKPLHLSNKPKIYEIHQRGGGEIRDSMN